MFHRLRVAAAGVAVAALLVTSVSAGTTDLTNRQRIRLLEKAVASLEIRVDALEAGQASPTPFPASPTPSAVPTPAAPPASLPPSCGTLQARIDTAAAGSILDLTGCSYSSGATVGKPLTIIGASISASGRGLTVAASDVTIQGVTITGPQATNYNSAQMGIYALATASAPIDNLVIRDSRISRFGHGGIWLRHLTDFSITGNTITDTVYSGIEVISGIRGEVSGNTVQRIGVVGSAANGGNAYGIALTRWTPTADEPASSDVVVADNLVESVPTWHGLDTHGGIRITFIGNVVRGTRDGIYVTGWPDQRATDVVTDGNEVYNTTGSNQYGITSVYSTGGQVSNNLIAGWQSGHAILTTSGGDPSATAVSLSVFGNVVQ